VELTIHTGGGDFVRVSFGDISRGCHLKMKSSLEIPCVLVSDEVGTGSLCFSFGFITAPSVPLSFWSSVDTVVWDAGRAVRGGE
jgi:hypothetical protein